MPHHIVRTGVSHLGISDHSLIYAVRRLSIPRQNPRILEKRCFKDFEDDLFVADLGNQPWNSISLIDDPNDMLHIWSRLFLEVLDKHAPIRRKRVRNAVSPWLSPHIKRLMFERDVLKKRAITGQSPNKWENYQQARNEVNRTIRKAKRNFFTSHLKDSHGDVKGTWKSKNAMINNLKVNGETLTDASSIADALNEYFVNVGPKLADQIPES